VRKLFLVKIGIFALLTAGICRGDDCVEGQNLVEKTLEQLSRSTSELVTYQCNIEYLFSQPLFDSKTLRKGELYYKKYNDKSALRINFHTIKQDDEKEKQYKEDYLFDGVWFTHIDYQLKHLKRYQQTEPNEPIEAFELAAGYFPVIGFSNARDLEKDFEIRLDQGTHWRRSGFTKLHLKVREDSIYKDNYISLQLIIDDKLKLPAGIIATSTEEDIYRIDLIDAAVNKKIDPNVFKVEISSDFEVEQVPRSKENAK